jgi:sugar phosphate isomerase/epimerase
MILSCGISDCASPKAPVPLKGELTAMINKAKAIGYDGVEIHLRSPNMIDFGRIGDYAAGLGMRVTSMCTGMAMGIDGFNLTHVQPEGRRAAQEVLAGFLRGGARMGGAMVSLAYMKGPINEAEGRTRASSKDVLYDSLMPCVELAEKLGNSITLEAVNFFECDYLWTAEETLEFVERFDSPHITVHLDTFHMNIEERDMLAAIRLCKDRLGLFHFSDNDRHYPGYSHIDYEAVLKTLKDIGFNGVGSFEFWPLPDGETAARRGLEYIKGLLAAL